MRNVAACLVLALSTAAPAHAIGNQTALLKVQEECVQIGDIAFGENQRWADCRVTRGRWLATIDIIDMYQVQYCLGSGQTDSCDQRALLVFGNRAYTPNANLLYQRIDPGTVDYDDPQVVVNEAGRFLTISSRQADGPRDSRYFRWQKGQWLPLDTQAWRKELDGRLPGAVVRTESVFDIDTLSATVNLYRDGDVHDHPSAGVATVELRLVKNRLALKKIRVIPLADRP